MQYHIASIPTEYAGTLFRSRLEARWAAFFDVMGWQWTYEPFDLPGWSPDFLLHGTEGRSILVEVKPITEFDAEVARKMLRAFPADPAPSLMVLGAGVFSTADGDTIGWLTDEWEGHCEHWCGFACILIDWCRSLCTGGDWTDRLNGYHPKRGPHRIGKEIRDLEFWRDTTRRTPPQFRYDPDDPETRTVEPAMTDEEFERGKAGIIRYQSTNPRTGSFPANSDLHLAWREAGNRVRMKF